MKGSRVKVSSNTFFLESDRKNDKGEARLDLMLPLKDAIYVLVEVKMNLGENIHSWATMLTLLASRLSSNLLKKKPKGLFLF